MEDKMKTKCNFQEGDDIKCHLALNVLTGTNWMGGNSHIKKEKKERSLPRPSMASFRVLHAASLSKSSLGNIVPWKS